MMADISSLADELLPPTATTYVLLVLAQALIWRQLYHADGPLRVPLRSWLTKDTARVRCVEINHTHLGVSATSPLGYATFGHVVLLHHSIAAAVAYAGYTYNSAGLTRLGLSFEIGEDILHYCEMAYSAAIPPGTELFAELYPKKLFWVAVGLHHILGLIAGSFAFFTACEWAEVQRLITLLLGLTVPGMFTFLLLPRGNLGEPSRTGRASLALNLVSMAVNLYGRYVVFVPLAWRLTMRIGAAFGVGAACGVGAPLLLFLLFSVLSMIAGVGALPAAIRTQLARSSSDDPAAPTSPRQVALLRASSDLSTPWLGSDDAVASAQSARARLGVLRAAGRMLMLRRRAREGKEE